MNSFSLWKVIFTVLAVFWFLWGVNVVVISVVVSGFEYITSDGKPTQFASILAAIAAVGQGLFFILATVHDELRDILKALQPTRDKSD